MGTVSIVSVAACATVTRIKIKVELERASASVSKTMRRIATSDILIPRNLTQHKYYSLTRAMIYQGNDLPVR